MKKKYFLIISICLTIVFIAVSYAFVKPVLTEKNKTETIVKTLKYGLIYTGVEEINSESMVSGDSFIKTFTVENTSNVTAYYNIYIENIKNTFINDELIYTLTGDNGIIIDDIMPLTNEGKSYLRVSIPIDGGKTHSYELKVTYKYLDDVAQTYNDNAIFNGSLGIDTLPYKVTKTYESKAVLANIKNETIVETTALSITNDTAETIYYDIMLADAVDDEENYVGVFYDATKNGEELITEKLITKKNFKLLSDEVVEPGEEVEYEFDFDKSNEKPVLAVVTSTYNSITAEYSSGSAKTGIKETKCYITESDGTIIKEGTLSGDNCEFSITPTSSETTYNFKKCITSNANNLFCSEVSSKASIGYCSKTTSSVGAWGTCSASCGGGTQTRTVKYLSAYDSSLTCSTPSDGVTYTTSQTCNTRGCCDSVYAAKSGSQYTIGHDTYKNDGSNPSTVVQYRTYCQVYQNKSNYNGQNCGSAYLKYCSVSGGSGSCGTYSSTNCSWRQYVSYFGGNSYNYASYYTSWTDSAKWHIDTFGSTSVYDYGDGAYYNDSSRNVHDWYNIS